MVKEHRFLSGNFKHEHVISPSLRSYRNHAVEFLEGAIATAKHKDRRSPLTVRSAGKKVTRQCRTVFIRDVYDFNLGIGKLRSFAEAGPLSLVR
jgi:hypothetical protein